MEKKDIYPTNKGSTDLESLLRVNILFILIYKALSSMYHMLQQYNRLRKYISTLRVITEGKITAGHDNFINQLQMCSRYTIYFDLFLSFFFSY